MSKNSTQTKQKLIEAAARVVKLKGASQLTLDAVAQEAQVSKGGLLYHFPNKSALLKTMVMYLNDRFEQSIRERVEEGATWLEAYVEMSFDPKHSQIEESAGMLTAIANDLSLLDPLAQAYEELQQQLEASKDPDLATIIRLAADGLWFGELFGISALTTERKAKVIAALLNLIKQNHD